MSVLRYRSIPHDEAIALYDFLIKDDYPGFCLYYEKYGVDKFYNYHDTLIVTATQISKLPVNALDFQKFRKYIDFFLEKKPSIQLIALLISYGESAKAINYIDVLIKQSYKFTITQTHTLLSATVGNQDLPVFQYLFNSSLYLKEHLINTVFIRNFESACQWLLETKKLDSPLLLLEIFCEDAKSCEIKKMPLNIEKYVNVLKQFPLIEENFYNLLNEYSKTYKDILFDKDAIAVIDNNFRAIESIKEIQWKTKFYYPFEFCKNWDLEDSLKYRQEAQYLYLSICLNKENTVIKNSCMNKKI